MTTLAAINPTLLDLSTRLDPDGAIAAVAEILAAQNEILLDMTWQEGNLPTGHRTTVRTGIPAPTWRKLYGGVQPTKSNTAQVTDNCGMLEAYAEVDKALADLNGNTNAFRMSENIPHIQGMNDEISSALFYANEQTNPEQFTGFAPRMNLLSAGNGANIIDAGGTGTDNASIYLVVWGPNTCHGIIPKGSQAGLHSQDLGEVTIENADGSNGRMQAYRSHYRWDAGLTVRDWRYVVRVANIDKSLLIKDASTGANLNDLMVDAIERLPDGYSALGRAAFYVPRTIRTMLRKQQISSVTNSTLSMENIAGKQALMFDNIPIRRTDALSADEARVV